MAERVGFEPTCACAQTDFEGRKVGLFLLYSLISSYIKALEKSVKSMTFGFLYISIYITLYRHFVEFYNNFTTQLHFLCFRFELTFSFCELNGNTATPNSVVIGDCLVAYTYCY